jgi:xanthine dehydrogenase YagS FAD-binding subunit
MNPVAYHRASSAEDAVAAMRQPGSVPIAGGTNLLDLMKAGVARPQRLVDVSRLPLNEISPLEDGGLRIGAMVRNSDAANHKLVRQQYPLLSQAMLAGASAQLRNMATMGGNLMQRTRCYYFYDPAFAACNKRTPGSGCSARGGYNRIHAILGASEQCIATHPSDMCVALAALGANIRVIGPEGQRVVPMADFHRLPGDQPERDTSLARGELITAIDLPPPRFAAASHYLKLRDRASYAFALVSVAAGLVLRGDEVQDAALALGGVAHKPWRIRQAEQALIGRALSSESASAAADLLLAQAVDQGHNGFKIELARRGIQRALFNAAGARA